MTAWSITGCISEYVELRIVIDRRCLLGGGLGAVCGVSRRGRLGWRRLGCWRLGPGRRGRHGAADHADDALLVAADDAERQVGALGHAPERAVHHRRDAPDHAVEQPVQLGRGRGCRRALHRRGDLFFRRFDGVVVDASVCHWEVLPRPVDFCRVDRRPHGGGQVGDAGQGHEGEEEEGPAGACHAAWCRRLFAAWLASSNV